MTQTATEHPLYKDIQDWADAQVTLDEKRLPDFWDEMDTTDRLAKYLEGLGYEKRN